MESLNLEVTRSLGQGAFGQVFLVRGEYSPSGLLRDTVSSTACFALKRSILTNVSETGLAQAQAEAQLLQRLGDEHECILKCFDFRVVQDSQVALELLLEFAPLGDLSNRIHSCKDDERSGLPHQEVVAIGCDIASGLAHIHSLVPRLLHRDIKPANVVLFPASEGAGSVPRAKIADFGIAKILETEGSLAHAETIIGTPHYFSPEMCCGEVYDDRSDAWALGCVIYEMVCLHRPFHHAEGNLGLLVMQVMNGSYDEEALAQRRQVGSLDCDILMDTICRLLTADPRQRYRACDALRSFQWLRSRIEGMVVATAMPWWRTAQLIEVDLQLPGEERSVPAPLTADSWSGAQKNVILDDPDRTIGTMREGAINALQEAILALAPSLNQCTRTLTPAEAENCGIVESTINNRETGFPEFGNAIAPTLAMNNGTFSGIVDDWSGFQPMGTHEQQEETVPPQMPSWLLLRPLQQPRGYPPGAAMPVLFAFRPQSRSRDAVGHPSPEVNSLVWKTACEQKYGIPALRKETGWLAVPVAPVSFKPPLRIVASCPA